MAMRRQLEIYRLRVLQQHLGPGDGMSPELLNAEQSAGYAIVDRQYPHGTFTHGWVSLEVTVSQLARMIRQDIKKRGNDVAMDEHVCEILYPGPARTEVYRNPSSDPELEWILYRLEPLSDGERRTLETRLAQELGIKAFSGQR